MELFEFKGVNVDWKDFFKLTVLKETLQGPHRYFETRLEIHNHFSLNELSMEAFEHLNLSEREKKIFSLTYRKILSKHHYFKTPEFERIVGNFAERIGNEKDQLLTFSTEGGGVYLFTHLLKLRPELFQDKRVICFTAEPPLSVLVPRGVSSQQFHLILRPQKKSVFKNFPTLWNDPATIDLYTVDEA